MDRQILNFTANEQILTCDNPIRISTNKVNYIEARFDLGQNWSGYDSVRAVWFNDFNCISTVLDSQGIAFVPFEVMKRSGIVKVNLVGSISEDDVLTDRLTSYPVVAVIVDCIAQITGAETNPITPSQFEQYVAIVRDLVDSVKDIDHIELNDDYTLTIYYSDGTSYTTTSIRGEQGDDGNGILSITKTGTSGLVDTYTITFTDGQTTTFTVTNGAKGDTGATPNIGIGTVTTLNAGSDATASMTGTAENPVLNLGIPKGADGSLTSSVLASTYSTSKKYSVGDYVYYNGNLYRCTTAITTAEAWTSAHWSQVALANDVSDLKDDLSDITVHGKNMFDVRRSSATGYYMKADGTPASRTGCSYSEYIPVKASETIYVSRALGSSSYPTVVQFDSSKAAIADSAVVKSATSAFSFTTEATTAYIVLNYSTSYGASIIVSDVNSTFEAYKMVGNGNVSQLNLYSADAIYYDGTYLRSKSNINLLTFKETVNFGTSVSVGSGKFLYYDSSTKTLSASNNVSMSENVYFVGILNTKQDSFTSLIRNRACLDYDAVNNSVKLLITANTFIYAKGAYYSISATTETLTSSTAHFLLYYSIADSAFYVTSSYGDIHNDDIVIMEAYSGTYNAICPVRVINGQYAKSGTQLYTFGDSLTWYDTQDYTWGDHEGEQCLGFQTYLQRYAGLDLKNNYGSSGKTTPQICSIIKNNISNINSTHFCGTIVTIMGGDNDDRLSVSVGTLQPIGSTFDTSTVYGALQDAIEALLTAKPTVRIVLMTEPMGWTYRSGQMVRVDESIPNAYRNVAKLYGLPLIDLWNQSGINELTRLTYYADPSTNHSYFYHPNNDGWKQISKIICHEIMDV